VFDPVLSLTPAPIVDELNGVPGEPLKFCEEFGGSE